MNTEYKPLTLSILILPRAKAEGILNKINQIPSYSFICLGKGTAPTDILDYLGLGETEKDVLFIASDVDNAILIKEILKKEIHFETAGSGIYFRIPLTSVAGPINYAIISGQFKKEKNNE